MPKLTQPRGTGSLLSYLKNEKGLVTSLGAATFEESADYISFGTFPLFPFFFSPSVRFLPLVPVLLVRLLLLLLLLLRLLLLAVDSGRGDR